MRAVAILVILAAAACTEPQRPVLTGAFGGENIAVQNHNGRTELRLGCYSTAVAAIRLGSDSSATFSSPGYVGAGLPVTLTIDVRQIDADRISVTVHGQTDTTYFADRDQPAHFTVSCLA
ncbi:MAG TPA: hypothetical protein VJ867_09820 [Gemmatimonadaceae bacterium]|nr:hypothetical protein [Gemmatimonadaceae bacterium]